MLWPISPEGLDREPLEMAMPERAPEEPPDADLFAVWAWSC